MVASGRRQDNLASGWRQDDVKRRGARINWLTDVRHVPCYVVQTIYNLQPGADYIPGMIQLQKKRAIGRACSCPKKCKHRR